MEQGKYSILLGKFERYSVLPAQPGSGDGSSQISLVDVQVIDPLANDGWLACMSCAFSPFRVHAVSHALCGAGDGAVRSLSAVPDAGPLPSGRGGWPSRRHLPPAGGPTRLVPLTLASRARGCRSCVCSLGDCESPWVTANLLGLLPEIPVAFGCL